MRRSTNSTLPRGGRSVLHFLRLRTTPSGRPIPALKRPDTVSSTPLPYRLHELAPFPLCSVIKWPEAATNSKYAGRATTQFAGFTPEKTFKAAFIHPQPDNYDW